MRLDQHCSYFVNYIVKVSEEIMRQTTMKTIVMNPPPPWLIDFLSLPGVPQCLQLGDKEATTKTVTKELLIVSGGWTGSLGFNLDCNFSRKHDEFMPMSDWIFVYWGLFNRSKDKQSVLYCRRKTSWKIRFSCSDDILLYPMARPWPS